MDRVTEGAQNGEEGDSEQSRSSSADARAPHDGPHEHDRFTEGGSSRRARHRPAEPLRASWRPTGEPPSDKRGQKSGLRRFTSAYGWRAYLVPVMLVVTALVVFDTARGSSSGSEAVSQNTTSGEVSDSGVGAKEPVVTENPAEAIDLDIPTAKLPSGGDYTKAGKGTWHVVPLSEGSGETAGESELVYTYTVEVEDGIDPSSYMGDDSFAIAVEGTLSDPRSWTGTGEVSLKRVGADHADPDFRVSLTTPETVKRPDLCGSSIPYEASCYQRNAPGGKRVIINLARWVRGAMAFNQEMTGYRQYAINHEVGHALNNGHVGCPENGALAPVMMQQTFGVANDYVARLNNRPGGDQGAVPADGKVCEPNGWPNPQAKKN